MSTSSPEEAVSILDDWQWAGSMAEEARALRLVGLADAESGAIFIAPHLSEANRELVSTHEATLLRVLRGEGPSFLELALPLESEGDALNKEQVILNRYRGGPVMEFRIRQSLRAAVSRETDPLFDTSYASLLPRTLVNSTGLYGLSPNSPVPVMTPYRALTYLNGIRTDRGKKVTWRRAGSVLSPISRYVVDCYRIFSMKGEHLADFFLDSYCHYTAVHAPGDFYFEAESGAGAAYVAAACAKVEQLGLKAMDLIKECIEHPDREDRLVPEITTLRAAVNHEGLDRQLLPKEEDELGTIKSRESLSIAIWLALLEMRAKLSPAKSGEAKLLKDICKALDAENSVREGQLFRQEYDKKMASLRGKSTTRRITSWFGKFFSQRASD